MTDFCAWCGDRKDYGTSLSLRSPPPGKGERPKSSVRFSFSLAYFFPAHSPIISCGDDLSLDSEKIYDRDLNLDRRWESLWEELSYPVSSQEPYRKKSMFGTQLYGCNIASP